MIDPTTIKVENRQRREVTIDDQFLASIKGRLINPIVLRRGEHGADIFLVAGGRRLEALIRLGISPLIENTHYRFFNDLTPSEAQIIELEENIKREDLPWRDQIRAFGQLHQLLVAEANGSPHSVEATGLRANIQRTTAYRWQMLYKNLDSGLLRDATGIEQAYGILQLYAERRAADVVTSLINIGKDLTDAATQPPSQPPPPNMGHNDSSPNGTPTPIPIPVEETGSGDRQPDPAPPLPQVDGPQHQNGRGDQSLLPFVLNLDFQEWAKTYAGPKFNLIHIDFPYGIDWESFNEAGKVRTKADGDYDNSKDLYWALVECFTNNLDRFTSYSAHVVFWFPMDYYERTRLSLEAAGLNVNKYPLVWFKSDGLGVMPGAQTRLYPRRLYETAFLCSRGNRTLVKALGNTHAAPHAANPLHPSHKPEPMLKHFFGMLVDETSEVLDPTCGSGSSLRVANDLGARRVLGLEIDSNFAKIADSATRTSFNLRKLLL
jgi:hypothetical protein